MAYPQLIQEKCKIIEVDQKDPKGLQTKIPGHPLQKLAIKVQPTPVGAKMGVFDIYILGGNMYDMYTMPWCNYVCLW